MEWSVDGVPEESCPALGFPDSPLKGKYLFLMSTVQSQLAGDLEEKKLIIILIWHFYENHQKETFVLIAYAGIFMQDDEPFV